jgi:hypothetical protein
MDGPTAGAVAFMCLSGATFAGVLTHGRICETSLGGEAGAAIRRAVWLIAVMATIILAALTVHLKSHFDAASRDVRAFASQIVELDRTLRQTGPAAEPARTLLFRYAARTMKDVWPSTQPRLDPDDTHAGTLFSQLEAAVAALAAAPGVTRSAAETAGRMVREIALTRWTLDDRLGIGVSPWSLVLVVLWMMLTFASLGLSARDSRVALGVLVLCAAALGSAVFLAVEYADPYRGVIIVSSEPMRDALFALSE